MSWDNNNLACILVFPPWQKQGLGQILMGASYEMSRREDRPGGPEKRTSSSWIHLCARRDTDLPDTALSDLGRIAYEHYWSCTLARSILTCPSKKSLTAVDLQNLTYIVPDDILATLQAMGVLEHRKRGGADAVVNKAKVRIWAEQHSVDLLNVPVDPESFTMHVSSRSESVDQNEE